MAFDWRGVERERRLEERSFKETKGFVCLIVFYRHESSQTARMMKLMMRLVMN